MRFIAPGVTLLLLSIATPTRAHRLDEYLQAAIIWVGRSQIEVSLRMAPGVAVALAVIAQIDTDQDGKIDALEAKDYVQRVQHDLFLTLDGEPLSLRLISSKFPSEDVMQQGNGETLLVFTADTTHRAGSSSAPGSAVTHTLVLENHHQPGISAYLANAAEPVDKAITILHQSRTQDQSVFTLEFSAR